MAASGDLGTGPAPSLRLNLVYAMSGRVVFALTQFGILSVVAHLGTTEDVGAMTLASAIVTPLFFLTSMGMRDVHAVDDLDHFTRADYVALRAFGGGVAVLLTAAIVLGFYGASGWLVQAAAIAFALVKFFGAQSSLNHGIFQRAERLDFVALSNVSRGVFGLAVFAAAFWASRDLPLALLFEALAWYLVFLVVDRTFLGRLRARTAFAELRGVRPAKVLRLAWWVLPVGVSLWLTRAAQSAPPIVLERHTDLATVGVFGALAYVHTAVSMFSGTLGSASAARLRRYYRGGKRRGFARLTAKLVALSALIGALGVAIAWFGGDALLNLLFGEAYRQRDLFTIIMLGSAISIVASPLVSAVTAGQAFRLRLVNAGVGFGVGVAAAVLLVPPFGAAGAAWAMVCLTLAHLLVAAVAFRFVMAKMPAPAVPAGPGGEAQ